MSELRFVLASCQYPAGLLDREPAQASYARLRDHLASSSTHAPSFLLLVGDQVYVDATAGLFDPTSRYDRFERPYKRLFRVPAFDAVRIPTYMMMDDHEIEDNWEPIHGDAATTALMVEGRQAYIDYQRLAGPDLEAPVGDSRDPVWFRFEENGFPFFVADTRTERESRKAETVQDARIMSESQFCKLLHWLDHPAKEGKPKLVASPSILLPRRMTAIQDGHPANALRSDAWDGYPQSLHRLLAFIADHKIDNVVFLSGDEHISCVTCARIYSPKSGKETIIHSVHSSALYAPFPFANSLPEDLAHDEPSFAFHVNGLEYKCSLCTEFPGSGDGFAILEIKKGSAAWNMTCDFHGAAEVIRKGPYALA